MQRYLLNLTSVKRRIELAPEFNGFERIYELDQIPSSEDSLILYILGHAIPDGLVLRTGATLTETIVAQKLKERRAGHPTLLIWDVCFAKSFEAIGETAKWGDNFVHIFSCREFERTWHTKGTDSDPGRSIFSVELAGVLRSGEAKSWGALQQVLQTRLGRVQQPTIACSMYQPSDFPIE